MSLVDRWLASEQRYAMGYERWLEYAVEDAEQGWLEYAVEDAEQELEAERAKVALLSSSLKDVISAARSWRSDCLHLSVQCNANDPDLYCDEQRDPKLKKAMEALAALQAPEVKDKPAPGGAKVICGTFSEYQDAMIAHAEEVQGENYPGDYYYRQDCWLEYFEDGLPPEEAVDSDMGYWE
jgi:hypothetical protein